MNARVCSQCHSTIEFSSVLTAMLPVKMDCKSCGKAFHVNPAWGWGSALVALAIGVAVWFGLTVGLGVTWKQALLGVIVWGLAAEYAYFLGLRSGIVPSDLVDLSTIDYSEDELDDGIVSEYRVVDDVTEKTASPGTESPQEALSEPENAAATVSVYPRIKPQAFVQTLQQVPDMDRDSMPLISPLFGDLVLTYAIDSGEQFVSLSEATAAEYGIDVDRVHDQALNNVIDFLHDIRVFNKDGMHELMCGGNMMATAVLFPELWDQIESELGQSVVIAVPHRDTILYVGENDSAALARLSEAIKGFESEDNHGLSSLLFVRDGATWKPLQSV